jgi:tRNA (guanine-N7-)-methyltransferase
VDGAADERGAFWGRRKGKRLRAAQAGRVEDLLPRLRFDPPDLTDPAALFPRPVREVWLEIGFGGGEHLLANARRHPDIGILGVEPFVNGMAKLLASIEADRIDTVRLHDGDATGVLAALPDASLARIDLNYPDPWPKRRHNRRRFVSDDSLRQIARVLRPGGTFRFVSDIDHYVGWTLARLLRARDLRWTAEAPGDWREPFPDWPGTRYEAKALREGRRPSYIAARRV